MRGDGVLERIEATERLRLERQKSRKGLKKKQSLETKERRQAEIGS